MLCRAVHEMIWTILFVTILGFGMLPGVIALSLFSLGFTGKLFSEEIEAINRGQVEAIQATGANPLKVFVYAVLPQVRVAWTGIAIYTWDAAFRAATVVGFFGAGGMGWYLRRTVQQIGHFNRFKHITKIFTVQNIRNVRRIVAISEQIPQTAKHCQKTGQVNVQIFNRYCNKNQDNQKDAVLYQGLGIFETAPGFNGIVGGIDGSRGHVYTY